MCFFQNNKVTLNDLLRLAFEPIFQLTKAWRQTPKALRFFRVKVLNDLFADIEDVSFNPALLKLGFGFPKL